MRIGICSYSFHRLLASGKQDVFKFIEDCKELGCTQLDPWNAHLADVRAGDDRVSAGGSLEADIPTAIGHLKSVGYAGTWGMESVPRDRDEYEGVKKAISLLHRLAA